MYTNLCIKLFLRMAEVSLLLSLCKPFTSLRRALKRHCHLASITYEYPAEALGLVVEKTMPFQTLKGAHTTALFCLAAVISPSASSAQDTHNVNANCFLEFEGEVLVNDQCVLDLEQGQSGVSLNYSGFPTVRLDLTGQYQSEYGDPPATGVYQPVPLGFFQRVSDTCWESENARVCLDIIDDMEAALSLYEGKFVPAGDAGSGWSCGEVGRNRGAYQIANGMLIGAEYGCRLSNPHFMEGLWATVFDGACAAEGTEFYQQIMISHWGNFQRSGVDVVTEYGTQSWERCGPADVP
jgi:hypothetical protein